MGLRYLRPVAACVFSAILALALAQDAHAQAAPAYLALGDSLAFGVGADNPAAEGYVGLTDFDLKADPRFADTGLDLINLSAPGATSADLVQPDGQLSKGIAEIQARASDDTAGNEVQIISLDIGGNDLLALADSESPCVQNAGSQACQDKLTSTLRGLQDNLVSALRQLREAAPHAEIYVLNLYNPYSGTTGDRALVASVGVQEVNGVIDAVASDPDFGAKLVSVFELFQGRAAEWIASDGIHPNNNGYRVMAEALLASIQGRAASLPADLLNPATPTAIADPNADSGSGGVDTIVVLIALPLVFLAGATLSATYFVVRGRR